jgi:hypothetical protein
MAVGKDGQTLFEAADTNYDLRLSPRELRNLGGQLRPFDRDQDGVIEPTELSHEFRITFSMGQPRLFNSAPTVNRRRGAMRTFSPGEGPPWFLHMDRNQDGDLSWSEFLGSRELFDRVDANSDELITGAEAAAVDSE